MKLYKKTRKRFLNILHNHNIMPIFFFLISLYYIFSYMENNNRKREDLYINEINGLRAETSVLNTNLQLLSKELNTIKLLDKIAYCESEYKTNAINPIPDKGNDTGLFQINSYYHGDRVKKLGLNLLNPIHNMKYALILYKEQGTSPWNSSKKCWSK